MSNNMKSQDAEYQDKTITKVHPQGEGKGWSITTDDGWSFFVPDHGIEPHVGDPARFYGRGIGYAVRGLDIAGREVFYRTREEEREQNRRELAESEARERQEFERNKPALDADYAALPPEFRRRMDRFRANNPDFRWKLEGYEMRVCKDAVLIAAACPTKGEIKFFANQDWPEQKRRVPGLSEDHSGNSFGAACRLAFLYVIDPKLVTREHGALCPLLGCKKYGCVPTTEKGRDEQ